MPGLEEEHTFVNEVLTASVLLMLLCLPYFTATKFMLQLWMVQMISLHTETKL